MIAKFRLPSAKLRICGPSVVIEPYIVLFPHIGGGMELSYSALYGALGTFSTCEFRRDRSTPISEASSGDPPGLLESENNRLLRCLG